MNEICRLVNDKERLIVALNNQLNDCINFDGGKLTDVIMQESSDLLKELSGGNDQTN